MHIRSCRPGNDTTAGKVKQAVDTPNDSHQGDTPMGSCESEATSVVFRQMEPALPRSISDDSLTTNGLGSERNANEISAKEMCWISRLVTTDFFHPCSIHESVKKNECNYFCSACTEMPALCRHCVQEHHCCDSDVIFFQIRRYMYRYVVHVDDLSRYYDCSGIQSYCINQRKAILLNPKDASSNVSGTPSFENQCVTCKVPLRPDCLYCCLDCKAAVPSSSIIPQTPPSSKMKKKQEPRIVKRKIATGLAGNFAGMYGNGSSMKDSTPRKKRCRSTHRERKVCSPLRSAFE
jgi:hypothetical protein